MKRLLALVLLALVPLCSWRPALAAPVAQAFKLDHFGFRPADTKIVVATQNPGTTVEVRSAADDSVVFTIPTDGGSITPKGLDAVHSGDTVWWIDFSSFSAIGQYRLHAPSLSAQSYDFDIRNDVYSGSLRTALRTFYLQRCNTPKTSSPASAWDDPASCHDADAATGPAAGHTDHGLLDLRGGWHDAGDYNKYVWSAASSAILTMLRAFEDNPASLRDDDIGIPESGNGIPDVLDEIRVELDWIMAMQLPGGSVLSQMHVPGFASDSPPSADTNIRYYQDPTLESGAVAAGSLALSSRIFETEGHAVYAATLQAAALASWTWLQTQGDSEEKVWAAAEIFRMDPTQTAARDYVDNFYPGQWSGRFFNVASYDTLAALAYVATPAASPAVVTNMLADMSDQVDYIFSEDSLYRNGMPAWSYYWGSNAIRAHYGLFLLRAAVEGATGSHSAGECHEHALDILHFFHGQNPLGMLYLTNMDALGGEHSSFQFYHAWYGDSSNTDSTTRYAGKPSSITEPAYPYYAGTDNHGVSDNKVSLFGPPPGFVTGGPNKDYGGTSTPPLGSVYYEKFYRDWADQVEWTARTWEITENSIGYQGPYVALAAYFLGASACDNDGTCEAGENATNCAADCAATIEGDAYVAYRIKAPPRDEAGAEIAGGNKLPASWNVTLDDQAVDASLGDDPENYTIGASSAAVTPAEVDLTNVPSAPDLHYIRYSVRPGPQGVAPEVAGQIPPPRPHVPRHWMVENAFGTFTVRSAKASSLLVPAGLAPEGIATAPADATHYLCYRVKLEAGPRRFQALARDLFDDCALNAAGTTSFDGSAAQGRCLLDIVTPVELCNPAAKSAVEPPRVTSAVIDESLPATSSSLLCYKAKLARKITGSAGLYTGLPIGAAISPAQSKHVKRRTADGAGVGVAPGNAFPAPVIADTLKRDVVCVPANVLSASAVQ